MYLSQHTLCTRKTELALEVEFYLDFHRVTRPWQRILTNGSDFKYVFPRCRCRCSAWRHGPGSKVNAGRKNNKLHPFHCTFHVLETDVPRLYDFVRFPRPYFTREYFQDGCRATVSHPRIPRDPNVSGGVLGDDDLIVARCPRRRAPPASRFFSICACSAGVREWKERAGSPGFRPGIFSASSCCLIVWYSFRLAGTEGASTESSLSQISSLLVIRLVVVVVVVVVVVIIIIIIISPEK